MDKFKRMTIITLLLLVLTICTGCSAKTVGRQEISSGGKKITILSTKIPEETEKVELVNDFDIEKIDKYAGVRGEDWISNETILITKENLELQPISVEDQMSIIRNLYSYNLKSGVEKSAYKKTEYMWMPIISPDKKYIFSENLKTGKNTGLILDLNGNIKAVVEEDAVNAFHISFNNARWIDNENVIVPSSGDGVCLININSSVTKIQNVGMMQTDSAIKLGDKIYYISVERKLISYDINTKQRKVVKDNVLNFELSPKKDMFAIEKKESESKDALVLIDLQGNEKAILTESKMIFGISFSPDQGKIAYVITSSDESKSGLYVMDISSKKSVYVSSDFLNMDSGLKWSPSSRKILASISEVKNMKLIDNTYVITLR